MITTPLQHGQPLIHPHHLFHHHTSMSHLHSIAAYWPQVPCGQELHEQTPAMPKYQCQKLIPKYPHSTKSETSSKQVASAEHTTMISWLSVTIACTEHISIFEWSSHHQFACFKHSLVPKESKMMRHVPSPNASTHPQQYTGPKLQPASESHYADGWKAHVLHHLGWPTHTHHLQ